MVCLSVFNGVGGDQSEGIDIRNDNKSKGGVGDHQKEGLYDLFGGGALEEVVLSRLTSFFLDCSRFSQGHLVQLL